MTHAHHWLLESESPSTYGTCKHCGERRFFEGHCEFGFREYQNAYYENSTAIGFPPLAKNIDEYTPILVYRH